MDKKVPLRSEVDHKYTWNAESVFPSPAAWEAELKSIQAEIPNVRKFQGHIAESPEILVAAMGSLEGLVARMLRAYVYAGFSYAVDTTDQKAAAMSDKAQGVFGQVMAAISFIEPELIAMGETELRAWLEHEPRLAVYGHYLDNLFRKQAHVRSAEVEELLGMLSDPFSGPSNNFSMLTNADFKFEPALDKQGQKIDITQGTLIKILSMDDRRARQTGWEHYFDLYLAHKNTLTSNLTASIKQFVFQTRVRKHDSSLAGSLFENDVPLEVFHNLIEVFKKNLPVWQRYFDIRRKALGVDELKFYDLWAPLIKDRIKVPFEQAVDLICKGLAPMGEDYVAALRKGCLEERWVDVYPNQGKRNGAFSWGAPGTYPFIMMSYADEIINLSTLAHELGHSMHSRLTWQNQPFVYSDYSLFVAEVASNFHQAMVRASLLNDNQDRDFQIAVIEEAMSNFLRYFFIMPTLARFELEAHERVERGDALTSDTMMNLMADLFAEGFGDTLALDRERVGMVWASFGHLFSDYYVYQYATGISGAHALSGRILRGESNAVEDYLKFLQAGASLYPLDALKLAGVDLTQPGPIEETFAVMSGYIDRLEKLLGV